MDAKEYSDRGGKFLSEKNFDGAIADFSEVIKLEPDNPFAYFKRGMSYIQKKEFDLAIADFTEAIRIEPNKFGDFYFERASAYIFKGNKDLAISDLEMAVKIDPQKENYRGALEDLKAVRSDNSSGGTGKKKHIIPMAIGFVVYGVIGLVSGTGPFALICAFWGIGIGVFGYYLKEELGDHLWITWDTTKQTYSESGFKDALVHFFLSFFIFGIWHLLKLCFWFLISPFMAIYGLVTDN